jgi:PAS domain S-box-containing protein
MDRSLQHRSSNDVLISKVKEIEALLDHLLSKASDTSSVPHSALAQLSELVAETRSTLESPDSKLAGQDTTPTLADLDVLEAMIEHSGTQLAYFDTDFNFVRVNAAYAHGCGLSPDKLIGRNHFVLFPNEENREIFEHVLATGEPVEVTARPFVYPNQPARGTTYWDWTLMPVTDQEERPVGLVLSLQDVTGKQRAQTRAAALARFPAENPYPIMRIRGDGTLIYANDSSDEILEQWDTRISEKVPAHWQVRIRDTLSTQEASTYEVRCAGHVYSITIVPYAEGYANLYGMDTTDLLQTQRALRRYAGRLRTLHEIDRAILGAESVGAIAAAALERVARLIGCSRASVMLFDPEADEAVALASYEGESATSVATSWRAPLSKLSPDHLESLSQGKGIFIDDLSVAKERSPLIDAMRDQAVRTLVRQPLLIQGELLGVLDLGLPDPGVVPAQLRALARQLATLLAIAIQQARLHSVVQQHAEKLEQRVAWRTAALQISEARFRAVFEDAPMGIALLDQNGRLVQCNGEMQAILGLDDHSWLDQPLRGFLVSEDAEAERQLYTELMAGKREKYRNEARFRQPDGQAIWCRVTVSAVPDAEQRPRFAIGMVEDVTEQRAAHETMIRNEKLVLTGQLAASLAHEINNPLQTVIGCLGLVDEVLKEDNSARSYLDMASSELLRAAGIVARLRDLNRPSADVTRVVQPLRDIVDEALAMTQVQLRDHNVRVHVRQDDGPEPMVTVAADRIHQVFLNLILNAVDAMPEGGDLTVELAATATPKGGRVVLSDTGVGITPEDQAGLFNPFFTTKPDGLGLGLFISQNIVENHRGTISVESTPGQGTSFTIWLPAG